jgi:hemoglobin/transferrin/lactoferrin receptor protein
MKTPTALFTLIYAALPVAAQDFLNPLIVTATRTGRDASDAAYSTAFLDAEYLTDNGRRTLPEALQYTPGVLVQKTAHGHGSPFIRGFTGRQNLLLVDGIRMNNSTFRSGPVQYWNTIDPLSIQRIELVRSQGSVLYGSDAVGGTLNAFSKFSDFRLRTTDTAYFNGAASYEYRTNGRGSHIARLEAETGIGGKFGVWLGLSAKEYGDIRDSSVGLMRGTGYPEQNLDFRIDAALGPDATLTFAHQYLNQDDVSRWHRTLNNPGWNESGSFAAPGTWTANDFDQERSLTYLRVAGTNPGTNAPIQSYNATLSYHNIDDSEFQNRNPASNSIRRSHIDVQTLGFDLTLESRIGPGNLIYGFDYYHDSVDSSGSQNNSAGTNFRENLPVADDSSYDLLGVFTQYIWEATPKLEITPGLRYTHARAELGRFTDSTGTPRTNESQSWDAITGSLRALYRLDDTWNLFGGVSQAFRAPNLTDLSGNLASRAGGTVLGSTNLEPEKFITYELGARRTAGDVSFQGAVFYTDIRDVITDVREAPPGNASITTNAGDGYSYGIELESAWRFHPQWTLSGFAAWQEGRMETPEFIGGPVSSKPMTRQLPITGSLALRWTSENEKYWIEGRILAAAREDRFTAADQAADNQRIPTSGTPSYVVASLYSSWQVHDSLTLTAGVENLTDTSYRNHGSGQNEPGLNIILGARATW